MLYPKTVKQLKNFTFVIIDDNQNNPKRFCESSQEIQILDEPQNILRHDTDSKVGENLYLFYLLISESLFVIREFILNQILLK